MSIKEVRPNSWSITLGGNRGTASVNLEAGRAPFVTLGVDYFSWKASNLDDLITTLLLAKERMEQPVVAQAVVRSVVIDDLDCSVEVDDDADNGDDF